MDDLFRVKERILTSFPHNGQRETESMWIVSSTHGTEIPSFRQTDGRCTPFRRNMNRSGTENYQTFGSWRQGSKYVDPTLCQFQQSLQDFSRYISQLDSKSADIGEIFCL